MKKETIKQMGIFYGQQMAKKMLEENPKAYHRMVKLLSWMINNKRKDEKK